MHSHSIEEVKNYCRSFVGAYEKELLHPNNVLIFYVHDKQFAYFKTSAPEQWRFSIRVNPERFLELTDQPNIKPARYMQRFHWISITEMGLQDINMLKILIDWSYQKSLSSLSKKTQLEILATKVA
ncbi:MmcQ/YjbR family DNA-binding protein [Iodobacter sp. CM08]|uniref:MmcQ/YjbR family DNA-binding protein n=1 Tax=Iodobacter sp. CM08 TaxID=3085902 RepID=UPI002980A775|nr:MmcQ/YjbR family DNA-binding protein [Iodobacter sp. CM08]MDW5418354.1 MmcQ/YjbR family DNA-binding protein [Iodobacter sp. CM08]